MSDKGPPTAEEEEAVERRFSGGDEAADHERQVAYFEGVSDREANADMGEQAIPAITSDQPATTRQLRYRLEVAREAGMDVAALDERAMQEFGVQAAALTRRDASTLIDLIQSRVKGPNDS